MHVTSVSADADTPSDDGSLTVGDRIRRRRAHLGWSQAVLARRMKRIDAQYRDRTDQSTFATYTSRWERNKVLPDEYNRRILAKALRVDVSDLGLPVQRYYRLEAQRRRGARRR
ncbi:helix-turn-helix transcriptional regulator [Actinoplanes sp. NBRC 103695]|uniref:helix-turn-helix domain-containing protein n=1 Tax=Actinoplanes sp. NBRC 103695 TaxID=3032202 RepID=UPI00249FC40C|nr:helix-turn-helix transcriptional regulator [Actinoplanes sp. NBRC 103695]GLZ00846.1 hypothetical protein Acsp02_80980 [Actinoplanes sp. NBRC 103695]